MRYLLILLVLALIVPEAGAQSIVNSPEPDIQPPEFAYNIVSRTEYGFLIPHRPGMRHLVQGHVSTFELGYEIATRGRKEWEYLYNYPEYGVALYYANLGNKEVLGQAIGFIPYINYPLYKTDKFSLKLRTGAGMAWVTQPFKQEENHKNIAIGSPLNSLVTFLGEAEYRLTQGLSVSTGLTFNHLSNSAAVTPNLGLNVPSVHLSLKGHFNTNAVYGKPVIDESTQLSALVDDPYPLSEFKKAHNYFVLANIGYKEIYPPEGPKYLASALSFLYRYQYCRKAALTLGADVFYSTSIEPRYNLENEDQIENQLQILQPGISFGYTQNMGKIDIYLTEGIYLYSKYKGDGLIYTRLGVRYFINEQWLAAIALKAHAAKADYFEYTIGYRLK